MKSQQYTYKKLHTLESILPLISIEKFKGKKIVFTNGCFDIIHPGHIAVLNHAAQLGDYLIVALNTDASVKRLKGLQRPIHNEMNRVLIIENLLMVDAVILFDEDTPLTLIQVIKPDVLVKGGDYTIDQIVGASDVLNNGGTVEIVPTLDGHSTTGILQKIQ